MQLLDLRDNLDVFYYILLPNYVAILMLQTADVNFLTRNVKKCILWTVVAAEKSHSTA